MSHQSSREQLKRLLVEKSVRHGAFNLVSGLKSSVYVDGKLTTCSAAGIRLVGQAFLAKMEQLGWHPVAVGGLTLGADPIVVAIARESTEGKSAPIDAFIVRKEPKKHGLQKFIEGIDPTVGMPVVIVDDVCTTGGSTALAIQQAREAGMIVLGALCLVDREMGAAEKLANEFGIRFEGVFRISELLAVDEQDAAEPLTTSVA